MNQRTDSYKLRQLRSKTDRQLLTLIQRQLNLALDQARSDDETLQARAIAAREEICRLLPLINDIPAFEQRLLESGLEELTSLLSAAV